jgi:hypothetical protein
LRTTGLLPAGRAIGPRAALIGLDGSVLAEQHDESWLARRCLSTAWPTKTEMQVIGGEVTGQEEVTAAELEVVG